MKNQKAINMEFKRLYGNLIELCRRVYAEEHYPRISCAEKFVEDLRELVTKDELTQLLTEPVIVHILEMSKNLLRTEHINTTYKSELRKHSQTLKALRANITIEEVNRV